MTGPEHYREAERLIVLADRSVVDPYGDGAECARQSIAAAQVHATLALAAAQAHSAVAAYVGRDAFRNDEREWARVTAPLTPAAS